MIRQPCRFRNPVDLFPSRRERRQTEEGTKERTRGRESRSIQEDLLHHTLATPTELNPLIRPVIPHIVGSLLLASSQSPAVNSSVTGDSRPATTSAPYAIRHSWQGGKEGEKKRALVGVKVCKRQKRFTSCVARNFERLLL